MASREPRDPFPPEPEHEPLYLDEEYVLEFATECRFDPAKIVDELKFLLTNDFDYERARTAAAVAARGLRAVNEDQCPESNSLSNIDMKPAFEMAALHFELESALSKKRSAEERGDSEAAAEFGSELDSLREEHRRLSRSVRALWYLVEAMDCRTYQRVLPKTDHRQDAIREEELYAVAEHIKANPEASANAIGRHFSEDADPSTKIGLMKTKPFGQDHRTLKVPSS